MKKMKVLIIDDDARNIFALSATLKAKSYTCISTTSAREAMELLNHDASVDVILMDMMMPDMDGYEAIPIFKQMEKLKHIPVIAVTAQAMVGDREKCMNAGADGYISKPIDLDQLLLLLQKL